MTLSNVIAFCRKSDNSTMFFYSVKYSLGFKHLLYRSSSQPWQWYRNIIFFSLSMVSHAITFNSLEFLLTSERAWLSLYLTRGNVFGNFAFGLLNDPVRGDLISPFFSPNSLAGDGLCAKRSNHKSTVLHFINFCFLIRRKSMSAC